MSPAVSRVTSPISATSGEYENDRSDFESISMSPKEVDEKEEVSQKGSLPKKEITRSKTEASINLSQADTGGERHSVGGVLSPNADIATNKFPFMPKRKHSSGDYPPIPPKPSVSTSSDSPKASHSTSNVSSKSSASSPSFIKSLSPKTAAKSPPRDSPSPKTNTTRSPSRSPTRSPLGSSLGKSHTIGKRDSYDDGNSRNRCATMSTQEAFHEHHMNKKRRRKSSDKSTRRFTTINDSGNPKRVAGSTLVSNNKFDYQFSPDMEERLQLKIEQGIQNTYGPIEKCVQAAITIQRYYRQIKMHQRFKKLRKEVISVAALKPRSRALSMKLPVRACSIRLKRSNPEIPVSILDGFPEYKMLTNRIASRSKVTNQPLQLSARQGSKDLGPSVRWRREASLEVQETVLQIGDKSVTPVRGIDIAEEDRSNDDVFIPMSTPSPEMNYSPSPDSDPDQSIKQRKSSFVPTSMSVDFLSNGLEEEPTARPHSISIMHHITRSKSMEELLVMDNETGKPKKPQLKPQESATSLKKKTNIGITLFNRLAVYCSITKSHAPIILLIRKPAKGILYLVLQGILNDSPKDVAHFIKTQYGLSKAMIGKFFSELHNEFSMSVLE